MNYVWKNVHGLEDFSSFYLECVKAHDNIIRQSKTPKNTQCLIIGSVSAVAMLQTLEDFKMAPEQGIVIKKQNIEYAASHNLVGTIGNFVVFMDLTSDYDYAEVVCNNMVSVIRIKGLAS